MIPADGAAEVDTSLGELRLAITFFNEADADVIMPAHGPDVKIEPPNLLKVLCGLYYNFCS
jgi:hypothetical protein